MNALTVDKPLIESDHFEDDHVIRLLMTSPMAVTYDCSCDTWKQRTRMSHPDHPQDLLTSAMLDHADHARNPVPVYAVVKNDYPVPCEHPLCETLHRRWMTRSMAGNLFHEVTRVEWVICVDGERGNYPFDEPYDTRREAQAALNSLLSKGARS